MFQNATNSGKHPETHSMFPHIEGKWHEANTSELCVCVHAHVKDRQKWLLDRMEEPLLKDIVEIPFLPEVFSQPRCIFFVVPAYHVTRNGQAGEACCWAGLFQLWQWAIALILSRNLFMLPLTFNMVSPKQQLPHQHLPNIKGYKKSAPKTSVV